MKRNESDDTWLLCRLYYTLIYIYTLTRGHIWTVLVYTIENELKSASVII